MNYKSHSAAELKEAQEKNQTIIWLDTDSGIEDDTLIIEPSSSAEKVIDKILVYHGLAELPANWSWGIVDWKII